MVSPEGFQKASAKLFCLRGVCGCGLLVLGISSDVQTAYLEEISPFVILFEMEGRVHAGSLCFFDFAGNW